METPLPSIPPLPYCSPKSKMVCLSLGLLGLLLVAILSFYLGRASVKPTSFSQTLPTPTTVITTPTSTSDPTADWKTYTNNEYSFAFKLPQNYNFIPSSSFITDQANNQILKIKLLNFHPLSSSLPSIGIEIYPRVDLLNNLNQWKKNSAFGRSHKFVFEIAKPLNSPTMNPVLQYKANVCGYPNGCSESEFNVGFVIETQNNYFNIVTESFHIPGSESSNVRGLQEVSTLFDQILSTFKFLD